MSQARYALYFAPAAEHPLWQRGCEWLGREPDGIGSAAGPAQALVSTPWRYGFHATLKAPLRLIDSAREEDWLWAVQALASRHQAFMMPALQVARLHDFLALCPVQAVSADHPLRRLADACVVQLDPWRVPPSTAEQAQRLHAAQGKSQQQHTALYGYPHVLDQWRFHMTLSNSLAQGDSPAAIALQEAAQRHFGAALSQPLRCDSVCVFVEPAPGQAFELRHRLRLGAR